MTAPSTSDGIVIVRGEFEYSLYSSLARAQRVAGGTSTFGLKIATNQPISEPGANSAGHRESTPAVGSTFCLGPMIERGCFNYRWPFNEYAIGLNEDQEGRSHADAIVQGRIEEPFGLKEVGTCALFSFVKKKVVYQVLRLDKGCRPVVDLCYRIPDNSCITLSIGGPITFRPINSSEEPSKGAICDKLEKNIGAWKFKHSKPVRLEAKLFYVRDGKYTSPQLVPRTQDSVYEARVIFDEGFWNGKDERSAIFIAAFRLLCGDDDNAEFPDPPSSEKIYTYVGADSSTSKYATGAMWDAIFLERHKKTFSSSELSEVSLIARCLEKITYVDIIPAAFREDRKSWAIVSNLLLQPDIDLKALL